MRCERLDRRIAVDAARGRVTSARARAFVRRSCPCAACFAWRVLESLRTATAPAGRGAR